MRSIFKLLERLTTRRSTVSAKKGGVAVGGDNSGLIVVNDTDAIRSAVADVMAKHGEARSQGVSGEIQSEIGRQIDLYRDKMNGGQVTEAMGLYSELLAHQAKNLSPHSIFRIKANIAICKHLLGEAKEAAQLLLEACTYAPGDDKAVAFKAFAFLISGDAAKAIVYGLAELEKNPSNEALAGFIIQAARVDSQDREIYDDPYENFSDELKKCKSVRLAHLHFLASKEVNGWKELAEEYLVEDPEELLTKSLVAQGILQDYINGRQSPNGFKFTADDVDRLKLASKYLEDYWADFRGSDRVANAWDLQVIHSLILSYKLSGDVESLRALCAYAMKELSDDQGIVETTAKCLLDLNEPELCSKAIDKLESQEDARKLRFLLLLAQKDWLSLARYQDYSLEKFEGSFLTQAKVVVYIARAYKGDARGKLSLENLLREEKLDSRARLLLFDFSNACGIKSIALIAHAYGESIESESVDVIEFCHYMKLVASLMLWKEVVLRLSSFPDAMDNYELKHMLALGYLNEHPLRVEAVEFFEALEENPRGYELLLGIFFFKRRQFEKVAGFIDSYYESGGRDLYGFLALVDIAKIRSDKEALAKLFLDYHPERYDGTPEQWMHVARGLIDNGEPKRALELAYKVYSETPNVAKVALGYFHVFLISNKDALLDDAIEVGAGCHIKLLSSEGVVIERNVPESIEDDVALSPEGIDPFVIKVLGQRLGFTYEQEKLQGIITWRLEEVKHKYLDAFHKISATYENQFPEEGGLWSIKVEDGNVQPLLDFVRRQAERDENFISAITNNHIPLSIAAGMWRKNIFQVSDLLRSTHGRIETCVGTSEERTEALSILSKHKGKAVVLDGYTVWVAAELGLLHVLNEYFAKIMVVQASIDAMRFVVAESGEYEGPRCNIGWANGVFLKAEFTEEEVKAQVDRFKHNISVIETCCSVVNFDFSSGLDDLTETLLDISPEAVAPYFLARQHNALFVSEDSYSRGFVKHVYKLEDCVWLQVVVNELLREGIMSLDHYCEVILGLCRYKHSFVSIHPYVIEAVFTRDNSRDLNEFKLICEYLGGPNADVSSHFELVMRFIVQHWLLDYNGSYDTAMEKLLDKSHGDTYPSAKVKKATSMMLERVRLMPDGVGLLNEIADYPILRLKKFIIEWWSGHFYK